MYQAYSAAGGDNPAKQQRAASPSKASGGGH